MPLQSTIAKRYAVWQLFVGVLCLGIGIWGIYDLKVRIPNAQSNFEAYRDFQNEMSELEEIRQNKIDQGLPLSAEEVARYQELEAEMNRISPDGEVPTPPSKFDEVVQWLCISSLPCAPFFLIPLFSNLKKRYSLDDDGTLGLPGEQWKAEEIADIDMSNWMAKSVAMVVHTDGRRVKLDDYTHKDLNLIIGAIAHRFYPEQWEMDAKKVKTEEEKKASDDSANASGSSDESVKEDESGPGAEEGTGESSGEDSGNVSPKSDQTDGE